MSHAARPRPGLAQGEARVGRRLARRPIGAAVAAAALVPRFSAPTAIIRPTRAGSAAALAPRRAGAAPRCRRETAAVAQHADGAVTDRAQGAGSCRTGSAACARDRHAPGVARNAARRPRGRRRLPPAASCWPAGWRRAGRCGRLAAGPQARHRAAALRVHRDAAHVVVRGRAHRDRLAVGVDAVRVAGGGDGGEAAGEAAGHAPARRGRLVAGLQLRPDGAGDDVARLPARPGTSAMKRRPVSSTSGRPRRAPPR